MILSLPLGHLLVYGLVPAAVLGVLCLVFTSGVKFLLFFCKNKNKLLKKRKNGLVPAAVLGVLCLVFTSGVKSLLFFL